MQKVEAIIRPDRLETVRDALDRIGIVGITVAEVSGHGRQRGFSQRYRGSEYRVSFLPKIKIETVLDDDRVEEAIDVIVAAARTGEVGDGKIFVYPVTLAVRVRTGESGDAALI